MKKMSEYYSEPSNPGFRELNERSEEKVKKRPTKLGQDSKFEVDSNNQTQKEVA